METTSHAGNTFESAWFHVGKFSSDGTHLHHCSICQGAVWRWTAPRCGWKWVKWPQKWEDPRSNWEVFVMNVEWWVQLFFFPVLLLASWVCGPNSMTFQLYRSFRDPKISCLFVVFDGSTCGWSANSVKLMWNQGSKGSKDKCMVFLPWLRFESDCRQVCLKVERFFISGSNKRGVPAFFNKLSPYEPPSGKVCDRHCLWP